MTRRLIAAAWAGVLVFGGIACHTKPSRAPVPPSAFESIRYNEGPVSARAKIFLVAGGDDIANFAAEIVEQRALWIEAGFGIDEIACYYAKPSRAGWKHDWRQYRSVAPALAQCHRADPARLQADLRAAASAAPAFVYLYVSAHGVAAQLPADDEGTARAQRLSADERAFFGEAAIGLDAGPAPRLGQLRQELNALRAGEKPANLMLTPASLADALRAFPETTMKVVVLQACFSGRFIDHHVAGASVNTSTTADLRDVPNLVALTATAAERPSFGCSAGRARTYFGAAYGTALGYELRSQPDVGLAALDWKRVFERSTLAVEAMERVNASRPSQPGMLDTRDPAPP